MSNSHQKKSTPLVSVVIPTYMRGDLLRRAIGSVVAQTCLDWELIVVDDASPDDSVTSVVAAFGDPRIRYIRHERNQGAPASRNTGIRAATGTYIALLDSDDEWLPEKLEVQLALFHDSSSDEIGVVVCNIISVRTLDDKIIGRRPNSIRPLSGNVYPALLGRRNMRPTSTILVKSAVLDRDKLFDEKLESSQEYDLLVRLAKDHRFETAGQYLVLMHHHEGARISTSEGRMSGMENALAKHYPELKKYPVVLCSHHAVLAARYCKPELLDMKKARKHLRQAIRAAPWMPSAWIWYLASLYSPGLYRRIKFAWPKDLPFGAWHRLEKRERARNGLQVSLVPDVRL